VTQAASFALYCLAADRNDAEAQLQVGSCYLRGVGVAHDFAAAMHWHHKSAEQGHAEAQLALSRLHEDGTHVPRNIALATEWCRKAADQGDSIALRRLTLLAAMNQD